MDETRTLEVKLRLWSGMANLKKLFLPLRPDPVILPTWGNDKCINTINCLQLSDRRSFNEDWSCIKSLRERYLYFKTHFSIHKQSCRHLDEILSDNNSTGTCLMILLLGTVCDTVLFIFTDLVLTWSSFGGAHCTRWEQGYHVWVEFDVGFLDFQKGFSRGHSGFLLP